MPQTIWHRFSGKLLMLLHMVCSVLLTVLHLNTLLLIGCEISTANQIPTNKWFLMATQRAKRSTQSERTFKTELKTGVRLFVAFWLTWFIPWQVVGKTLSDAKQEYVKWIQQRSHLGLSSLALPSTLESVSNWKSRGWAWERSGKDRTGWPRNKWK